ncbi:MAG: hypothetical protein HFJ43_05910 [Clostridia bacterium]|nr:hypothetical protein [Clostridia bacterium]
MITKVENNIIFKNKNPIEIKRKNKQMKNIKQYWSEFIKNNKNVYNGNVYCITNITKQKNETIFELSKTKYEDVVYSEKHSDLNIRILFFGTYFVTVDGYYCIVKNDKNKLDLAGGYVDDNDFENDSFNPKKCLFREVKEELGIDIRKNQNIKQINLKYLKLPNKQEDDLVNYPIGIIYESFLNLTSDELEKEFNKNKHIIDGEIKEIVLIKDFNILDNYDEKVSYLLELFECIKNEKVY